jgi:NitT/TauT family transport system substrate-binding protein
MPVDRRGFLKGAGALTGLATLATPAGGQAATKIRIGYLHTLAVDAQMWLSDHLGAFAGNQLEPEFKLFQTGLELFQAMIGGSLDVLVTGAVISNFPARGQGKMFLANSVEFATAQLWIRPGSGIESVADLKGKRVATTMGTTAHVFLSTALNANGVALKDVDILNQRMPDAVTSFISGAVPAVALWVPFNITVRNNVPGAKRLVDASAYYPQAAIVGGWAATSDYHAKNEKTLANLIRAWSAGNEFLVSKPEEALAILQQKHYAQVPLPDLKEQFQAEKVFSLAEWRRLYSDGTVTQWLQQVTDFFAATGNIQNAVPAAQYFDTALYLKTVKM